MDDITLDQIVALSLIVLVAEIGWLILLYRAALYIVDVLR